ncbi:MAG TPA: DUF4145 domain-containing protein [Candidatus Dormibacteraeota bacterium]|nr:DUF4145 domain-containing protein [Candidatus Dormibacteraeota bacterium]
MAEIAICGFCGAPTFFLPDGRFSPTAAPGEDIADIPEDVAHLYREARISAAGGANTAAVLVCRKILMHIAVDQEAPESRSFLEYVTFLADKGFLPPNGRLWVDYVRRRGNEANHQIQLMDAKDAEVLIRFTGMLLQFLYELPGMVPQPSSTSVEPAGAP